jgi:molybdopterin converting factor small subunit
MTTRQGKTGLAIEVVYFGLIRNVVPAPEEKVTVAEGATVRDLFHLLCERHGERFRDALFTVEETLLPNAIVLLDGSNIFSENGLETKIDDKRSTHILLTTTAIGGG